MSTDARESIEMSTDPRESIERSIERSIAAFKEDFSGLLASNGGKWVAYIDGRRQEELADTKNELLAKYCPNGEAEPRLYVVKIQSRMEEVYMGYDM